MKVHCYNYDLESIAFEAAGYTILPDIVQRKADGTRGIFPAVSDREDLAYGHFLALTGCLDARVEDFDRNPHITRGGRDMTEAERERLTMLVEECGEVIQAATKALRHGYESRHPDGGPNNQVQLESELNDVLAVMSAMVSAGDITKPLWRYTVERWRKKLRWTHHQGAN